MAYRIVAVLVTLRDLHCQSPIACLYKWDFCTVVQQLTGFQMT